MAMNPTNGMAAGQPGTGNPFARRSGQVPAAQDVQGRQAPREEQAAQPIGPKQLSEATQVLLKYKSGKAALDRRIVENEHWYRLHRDTEDGNFADSGWMFNSLANKHADAMDNYPEPNVLPRAQDDADTAKELSSILPVALDQNDYEQVYSDAWWYKLKHGTAVKGVFWNGAKDGGLGDIDLRLVDLLNLYWEPGITDIQASRNVFHVELVDNEVILEQWPFAKNHLGQGLTAQRYQYDESIDTSDKSLVVDWYYKRRGVLHYCKYVGECVLYTQQRLFDGVRPGQRVDTDGRVGREPGVHRQERHPVVRGHRHQQRDVAGGDPERAENHDGGRHHHFLRGHPLPEIRMVARQQLSGHHDRAGG